MESFEESRPDLREERDTEPVRLEPLRVEPVPESFPARVPNLLHFLLFLGLTIASLVVGEGLALLLGSGPLAMRMANQRLQLGAESLAYALALGVAWPIFRALWKRPLLVGLSWNGAGARSWMVLFGLGLGIVSQATESLLPTPKHAPIEDLFRAPGVIWFLAGFGTLVAPLFEEILFRGFLLPGLAHAVDWMRVPKDFEAMEAWRVGAGGLRSYSAGALVGASLVTSLLFALIHAPQIGYTWSAVGLLAGVSLVLCWVRVRYDSLAASTLCHACYNLSVFLTIFIGTSGFRHLDRAG
jgi:membrane protease YdiL (CAAX protease family)